MANLLLLIHVYCTCSFSYTTHVYILIIYYMYMYVQVVRHMLILARTLVPKQAGVHVAILTHVKMLARIRALYARITHFFHV